MEYAKVLDRVGKLLRMARGQANQHESAVAAAMAERLMREYQIEQCELVLDELCSGEGLGSEDVGTWRRCPDWQGLLAVATARLFECEVDRCEHPSRRGHETLRFYGYVADTTVAVWTFEYLVEDVRRSLDVFFASSTLVGGARCEIRQDYRMGAVCSLLQMLEQATQAKRGQGFSAEAVGECAALISRCKKAAIGEAFGGFEYQPRMIDGGRALAYGRGRRDGRRIELRRGTPVGRSSI